MNSLANILFSLAIAVSAEAILMWNSAEQVAQGCFQVIETVHPFYFWPFMLICATDVVRPVGHDLAMLTSIPYTVAPSTSLLMRS